MLHHTTTVSCSDLIELDEIELVVTVVNPPDAEQPATRREAWK
jgi:hypothetical protein